MIASLLTCSPYLTISCWLLPSIGVAMRSSMDPSRQVSGIENTRRRLGLQVTVLKPSFAPKRSLAVSLRVRAGRHSHLRCVERWWHLGIWTACKEPGRRE